MCLIRFSGLGSACKELGRNFIGIEIDEEYYKMRDALHMYYMTDEGGTQLINPFTGERSQYEWTNPFR